MANEKSMTHVIILAVIKAAKAVTMAVREADNPVNNASQIHITPRSGGPVLRHV